MSIRDKLMIKYMGILLVIAILFSCTNNKPAGLRDYQLEIYNDSTQIWDGSRLVATIPYDSTSKLDLAINKDNQ